MLRHRRGASVGGGCDCEDTVRVLAYLGARQSAEMHAHPDRDFPPEAWFEHMQEEDDLLCPLLERRGYGRAAKRIADDHRRYRTIYARTGTLPLDDLHAHGKFEDEVIREALPDLIALSEHT
jgi:hypothetical protein